MNEDQISITDEELSKQLAQLDWEIEPDRDLWPDISSRIRFFQRTTSMTPKARTDRRRNWAPYAIAASVLLACFSLLFSFMSFQYALDNKQNQQAMLLYQQAQLNLIEEQHQLVRVQFVQLLQHESLSPDFVIEAENVMQQVDSAAAEIKQALKNRPNSPDYHSMLVNTYQHELKLLNQLKSTSGLSI